MNSREKDIKIFTANSNSYVGNEIVSVLGLPLGQSAVSTFADGEISVTIGESVRGSDVFVIQSTSNTVNHNLMELLIMIDAFKRASAGRITAVHPYFSYARQDRKSKARDPISAKLVADLITTAGADRILTMDLHAAQIQGFFNIPVDHLLGISLLTPYFASMFMGNLDRVVAVSPDLGSVTRARMFAEKMNIPLAVIDKRRQNANESKVHNIIGDVRNKSAIIVDDMIDTAGTLCNAAQALCDIGRAVEVHACATHGVLSNPAYDRISKSPIKKVVLLNTIQCNLNPPYPKIEYLSVAPLFAEAIKRIHHNLPVSPLFE